MLMYCKDKCYQYSLPFHLKVRGLLATVMFLVSYIKKRTLVTHFNVRFYFIFVVGVGN